MNGIVYSSLGVMMAAVLLTACGREDRPSAEKEGVETVLPAEVNEVSVMTLKKGDFNHELVSNGKVEARAYADLNFRLTSEPVARVYVKNGDRVKKGQKLAELSLFTLQNKLEQAKTSLDQADLEMQDVLIGQGYAPDRPESVPENVMKLARVRSGYEQSRANYELARYELQQAVLTAPFDGVVANLFGKQYNRPDGAEPFCRIIATAGMEVEFSVLESELPLIRRGDEVDVSPYAATVAARKGRVTEINPLVDENGMVRVKAQVDGGSQLFDGMNVRVTVKRRVPGQLVVPKTAVVLRSGRQVVFTLREGKAQWNYVQTGLENMTEYTVTGDGLEEGAQVIVTGNVNLAHETPVRVVGQKK
ncbi:MULTISPECIES: efflux RND transporter periplasmic adaptor subunit [Mediterranea]|mgnify:FL=1|uniref:efflux RND transporter periplasmic adaptor subunit n=1 Tax=Mediterranea TaxID=1926659 RepID=UPI0003411E30|nr:MULTISPECIES: efflux RND transporter periplasmic adaptor subunit [Mediterranea]MCL1607894.1 efflux RND transporter periplasmic adaptor subunit [Mediterranea sp. ET5]MDM8123556.1 efflux RND transporter periplasmic adaptor subunit [Mediterranea massiliensis]MDM8199170.1 efflux RND transporter periplasmic adaptor subunit [Mediterranea massiliensis]CDD82859.1 cation efflux system protein [Bacteroides sp. CAG:462]